MKRILPVAVTALLLVAGCSTGGGNDATKASTTTNATSTTDGPTTTTEAPTTTTEGPSEGTVDIETWAGGFCGSFADWTTGIQDLGTAAEEDLTAATTPAEARDAVVATFDGASSLTTTLIDEVEAQDPPDMDDGEGMVALFTSKFQEFADVIDDSRTRAQAVDVDASDFGEQVQAIYVDFENDFTSIGNSFGEIDRQYPDPEFQRALTSACGL